MPWELGLAETHQTLVLNNLRSRIAVETDGQLKTGRDVVIAALLGAEEFGFATAPLVTLGCIMMRVCHLNTCPVGVATQDPRLRKKFTGDPEHMVNFMMLHRAGSARTDGATRLPHRQRNDRPHRYARAEEGRRALEGQRASISRRSFTSPRPARRSGRYCQIRRTTAWTSRSISPSCSTSASPPSSAAKRSRPTLPIKQRQSRRRHHPRQRDHQAPLATGLPDDTIHLQFHGSAGQSFGAFVPKGVTLELEGDANDYVGKGLSGGKIIVYPPAGSTFVAEENIIVGNVALYGATGGEAYIRGMAGERFSVRNSGVNAVVEAVGDHGCEYMTGGRVVVLGATGRNFAAGMSGGVAYVLDEAGDFPTRCNQQMVGIENMTPRKPRKSALDDQAPRRLHPAARRAFKVLALWDEMAPKFVKVMPKDYKRVLTALKKAEQDGLSGDEALNAAFEANARDVARIGGG